MKIKNAFNVRPRPKSTPRGCAGFDNPRENIDPHIKTQVINSREMIGQGNIRGVNNAWDFTIIDPNSVYDTDTQIFIAWAIGNLTITKIQIELDATTNQVLGDLKCADDFIALTNASLINSFDTTSGKRTDTSITNPSVSSGKAIYLQFDSQPNSAIKQMQVHIEWKFD